MDNQVNARGIYKCCSNKPSRGRIALAHLQSLNLRVACEPRRSTRSVGVWAAPPRDAETVENYPRSIRAIERVEMNAGNVVIQKIVTLFQGEVNTNAADHFGIVSASLQSAQKLGRETRAAGQLGDAFEAIHGRNRHDAGDNGDMNVGKGTTFAEIEEVAIIEK